jgi:hypothetical protein
MSVDAFFFVRDENLPTVSRWQTALDRAGVGIVLADVGDLRKHSGYLPAAWRGQRSGFEWFYGPLAEMFGGEEPHGLNGRRHVINCVTHSDMMELVCGLIACSVLAQIAGGVFLDDDSGNLVGPNQALEMALGMELQEQERKKREQERNARFAERDAATTNRRCPRCGSLCPEYRKTCRACGFEIGRAL